MSIIKILQYPHPRLKTVADPVLDFNDELQAIIDDMFDTHYNAENCAALAASQLDFQYPKRITVIDFSERKNEPLCLINPEIIESSGEATEPEGCMSLNYGILAAVTRAAKIKVQAQDRYGNSLCFEADGFMSQCIQHEIDHLNGHIFLDHLSTLKRYRLDKKIKKMLRSHTL